MIFRYSITTICMLALASISIAMNQDQVRESDKNSTVLERPLPPAFADELEVGSQLEVFDLILTDESVQKLEKQGRLVLKVSEDVAETVTSIQVRLENSLPTTDFMKLTTSPHWNPQNNTLVFRFADKLLSQLKHCLLYTSPSPRDRTRSRMPSSA